MIFFSVYTKTKKEDFSKYQLVQLVSVPLKNGIQKKYAAGSKICIPAKKEKTVISEKIFSDNQEKEENLEGSEADLNEISGNNGDYSGYLPFFQVLRVPEFLNRVQPVYPPQARLKGVETEVIAEVYIDINGNPRKVLIIKSGGVDFDNAIVEALYKSTFSPAVSKEMKPVPVKVKIPYKFELE